MTRKSDHVDWQPTDRQAAFLRSPAYEVLFGGAAGGGKSEALLAGALQFVEFPSFRGLILRRTFADLERSLIDRARGMFRLFCPEADYNETKKVWRFPSGAQIYFGHLEHEKDKYAYQSAEFSYIAFDELTHFTETQYTYMLSRARSSKGLGVYVRAATNPGGEGHAWVMRRWAPWLDPTSPVRAGAQQILGYSHGQDDTEHFHDHVTEHGLSRVFIPARVQDNPYLHLNDPGYVERLRGLDPVTRAQLLDGDWLAVVAEGALFKPHWFKIVDAVPRGPDVVGWVRYWDRASTAEEDATKHGRDADYTVGVRMLRTRDGLFWVDDVVRFRGRPAEVMGRILQTAQLDGRAVQVGIEQDPGSSGAFEADAYIKALAGFSALKRRPTGDKITRAKPASAQVEAGNVRLLRATWNRAFLNELEAFPDGPHDDQVDAFSGAFTMLAHPLPSLRESIERWQSRMPKARWAGVGLSPKQRESLARLNGAGAGAGEPIYAPDDPVLQRHRR